MPSTGLISLEMAVILLNNAQTQGIKCTMVQLSLQGEVTQFGPLWKLNPTANVLYSVTDRQHLWVSVSKEFALTKNFQELVSLIGQHRIFLNDFSSKRMKYKAFIAVYRP